MERTIISLDYAIKTILRDKANFDVLSGFLTELLEKPVEVQEILESEGNIFARDDKTNRLDLKAKLDSGEFAVFEIQFFDQLDFFGKVLFNACKAVVEQVSIGQLFDIKKVYSVNIAYFDLGAKQDYVFRANLKAFTGIHFNENIPFSQNLNPGMPKNDIHPEYFLILPNRFDEKMRGKFDEWVYTLKKSAVRSDFTAAGLQAAAEKLDILKMTKEERAEYEKYKQTISSFKSQMRTAVLTAELKGEARGEKKGLAKGLAKGKAEKAIESAKEMLADGVSIEKIAKYTGLTAQEIKTIGQK